MRQVAGIAEWLRMWSAAPNATANRVQRLLDEAHVANAADHIYTVILDQRARQCARQRELAAAANPGGQAATWRLPGVPVAIKDNIEIAGTATSCGSRLLARPAAARDAAIVSALEASGAIPFGKTTMDEAALGASGRNQHFGRCANPRDRGLLSGGSSSGSAAAVAAGHAPLAIGTDTLGSVRIPAALCRVVGFKPTHGLLSTAGVVPLYPAFDSIGLFTGSLPEASYVMQTLCPQARAAAQPAVRGIRLLCLKDSHLVSADAGTAQAYRECIDALDDAIVHRDWLPAFDFIAVSRAAWWEVASSFAARVAAMRQTTQRPQAGSELAQILERARAMSQDRLRDGRCELESAAGVLRAALMDADVLLTPTCPVDSVPVDDALPKAIAAFVAPANVAGLPAVSWPQTLPGNRHLALQLIGRAGDDLRLLELAQQMQQALAH